VRAAAALLVAALGCGAPAPSRLPGAPLAPELGRQAFTACGVDIMFDGHTEPDLRVVYTYDALGRLARETGTYTAGGTDVIDYGWDHLGHLNYMVEIASPSNAQHQVTAEYDTLGDLLAYSDDDRRFVYSDLDDVGLPTREVISAPGKPDDAYELDYDAAGRIVLAIEQTGSITTYTYDDLQARTLTIDTDHGAVHGVIIYDDASRELSETWDGTSPTAVLSETRYEWSDGRLLTVTYHSGTMSELQTLRYDCHGR
jgi:YD repeat-containing protein